MKVTRFMKEVTTSKEVGTMFSKVFSELEGGRSEHEDYIIEKEEEGYKVIDNETGEITLVDEDLAMEAMEMEEALDAPEVEEMEVVESETMYCSVGDMVKTALGKGEVVATDGEMAHVMVDGLKVEAPMADLEVIEDSKEFSVGPPNLGFMLSTIIEMAENDVDAKSITGELDALTQEIVKASISSPLKRIANDLFHEAITKGELIEELNSIKKKYGKEKVFSEEVIEEEAPIIEEIIEKEEVEAEVIEEIIAEEAKEFSTQEESTIEDGMSEEEWIIEGYKDGQLTQNRAFSAGAFKMYADMKSEGYSDCKMYMEASSQKGKDLSKKELRDLLNKAEDMYHNTDWKREEISKLFKSLNKQDREKLAIDSNVPILVDILRNESEVNDYEEKMHSEEEVKEESGETMEEAVAEEVAQPVEESAEEVSAEEAEIDAPIKEEKTEEELSDAPVVEDEEAEGREFSEKVVNESKSVLGLTDFFKRQTQK